MHHEFEALPDPDAVARAGAAFVAERARDAVAASGSFHFAVSGGHTPWAMFAELAAEISEAETSPAEPSARPSDPDVQP